MLWKTTVACAIGGSVICLTLLVHSASAEPAISNLSLRGLQAGATTTLTVDGTDLLPAPKLMLTVPIVEQKLFENGSATRVQFEIKLDSNTTPGLYNLRLANSSGISATHIIAIDQLPQLPFVDQIDALPCTLHGTLSGSQVLKAKLSAKAGQLLMLEVEAQRLGSALRPVLHVRDAQNKQVAFGWPSHSLAGDARLITKLPADGEYTIELHDTLYAVPGPGYFRLKVGEWKCADIAFPAAVQQDTDSEIMLLTDGQNSQRLPVTFTAGTRWQPVPWPSAGSEAKRLISGWRPKVLVSNRLELLEAPTTADTVQDLSLAPVAINGRLTATGEEDKYRLSFNSGAKVRLELFAQRLGAQLDTEIELQDDKGARLAINDDVAGSGSGDSMLEYTPAADVSSAVVVIRDIHGRGGEASVYRLVVTPLDQPAAQDFKLIVADDRQLITAGTHAILPVMVERNGYQGAIRLMADGLPSGVELQGELIPAEATGALLTLKGTSAEPSQIITQLRGEAIDLAKPIVRVAEYSSHTLATWQPWMANEIGLAVKPPEKEDLQIDWEAFAKDFTLPLGAKLELPVRFNRAVADGGPVRVTLLTSQHVPEVNGKPDLKNALRQETANLEVVVNPQAKAAADALTAADKVLADAQTKEQAAIDATAKADEAAEAVVTAASKKLLPTEKTLSEADEELKTASETKTRAEQQIKAAQAAVADAASKGDEAKTKAAAGFATAQAALTVANQAHETATQHFKASTDAQVAAAKMFTEAQSRATDTKEAGSKAVIAATKVVTDATAKRDMAQTAADKALADAKYESKVSVIVPGNLPELTYDLAFRLELLSANKQQVLNTVYTSVRKVETLNPLLISLDSEAHLESKLDPAKETVFKVSGILERRAGMKSVATVSLEGLPPGVPVPKVTVPADKKDFELELKFPANTKPGKFENINVAASAKMEPGTGELVQSQPVMLSISLTAANP